MSIRNIPFRHSRFPSFAARLTVLVASGFVLAACSEEIPTEPETAPSGQLQPAAAGGRYVPGRVLVRFRAGADEVALARAQGAVVQGTVAERIRLLRVNPGREMAVARSLGRRADVEFAEPDWLRTLDDPTCPGCALPGDPLFGYKWDLHNDGAIRSGAGDVLAATGAADADTDWLEAFNQLGAGFSGSARIGILDTGVRSTHADLSGRVVAQHDFYNNDPDASDDQGHGTHVAGIAAARGGDAAGLTGVAWGPNIGLVVAKVCTPTFFGLNAECPSSALAAGITWAVDQGANVLNISLGGTEPSETEQFALQYARDQGVLPFCAAGNSGVQGVLWPAAFPECIAVSATDWSDGLASYSNWGPEVRLAAPGGDSENASGYSQIASTCFSSDVDYCLKAGTSMATPQAAGLGALLHAMGLSSAEVLERMESTADDLGDPGVDDRFGHGRINVWRAVNDLPAPPPNPPPTADFSQSCTDADCAFTDLSTDGDGTVVGWAWTFGDGGTSSQQNPTHAYACSGTYPVTLRVTDDGGAIGTATRSVSVSVPTAGGGPGEPGAIPGLMLWLRADGLTGLAEGDPVGTWPDASGSCNHATQASASKRPTFRVAQVAGLPAVSFDAADDGMETPVDPPQTTTIVAVYSSRAGATGHVLNGGFSFFEGPYVGRYRAYTGKYLNGPTVTPGRWVVQGFRQTTSRAELWIDGTEVTSTNRTVNPGTLLLARQGTYSQVLDGALAELLVYDRALSDAELDAVHAWLHDRYVPPPAPNQPPAADFAWSCTHLTCAFADASADSDGTVTGWSWEFGDGEGSVEENPDHDFAAAATYQVTLTVTDDDGESASVTKSVSVEAPPDPGPFEDPASLPGLVLWLQADALSGLAEGAPVVTWPDRSGAGNHAAQAVAGKRPAYRNGMINGLPAVQFDAADDGMSTAADPATPVTVVVVYATRATASGQVLNGGFSFFMGPYVGRYRNYTGQFATGPSVTAGRWLTQTLRQSTGLAELFVDGVFTVSTTRTANPAPLKLAREGTYGAILDGWVAEVIVYDRALDDAELADVHTWLRQRYALP
ncbi:MAG TPA: S8 family serine peptidase [Gemmatimonadota bacterium]|nr:S8 family serine peptidase [Gemmatimonadota bacterium]